MAKTKNLGILGADNIINTRKQITRGTSVKPKKGMKYYDLGKKKKKKDEIDIRTIKNEDVNKRNTLVNNTPNKDGYIKTNKKYGDYDYHDYSTKKNYDIYKKDNKAYYFDPKTKSYVDMDQQRISTPEIEKKEKKKALKEGFKGNEINKVVEKTKLVPEKQKQFGIDAKNNKKGLMKGKKVVESKKIEQVSPRTFAEQVELDTSGLSKKEKKQFTKDLIAQHKKENKKLSYVREGSATGELKNMFVNPNNNFQKEIAQPLADAERIYRQGKLNNELAMQYYNKMEGKKNDIAGAQRKIDLYNKFNRDLTVDKNGNPVDLGLLGNSIQNLNTQVESLKKQGIVATGGSLLGAGIGAVAGLRGGNPLGGAVAGAKIGGKAGYVTGSTPYIYQLEAGNQYKDLLDMGVSDDKAKEISKLTGVINASIESGENIADLVMLGGGKLAKNTIVKNAISKNESVIGKIIKTLGPEKAQNYLEKTYGKEIADVLLKSYGANIVSEGTEEALQETVGIAGKRSAANAEGIEYQNTYRDDLNQILNAAKAGAGTAALIGGAQAITTNTASFGTNKLSQMAEVINQTNNGEITQEQANQKFEQINDGTYQQNQNYQTIANQEYQNLQNQLQSGQITDDQYIQELKNLNETINITREQINTSQKEAKMKAMQERIQQMDVNGYISNNYTDKQIQDFMEQVYDDNLSAEELQDNLYNVMFKDSAKKQATNVLEISAKDTNMTRDEFIKRHYTKNMDQEFDVTKEDVGKIYDKYHKKETKKDNYEELKKKAEKEVVKTTSQKSGKKGRSYQGKFFSDDNFNLLDDDDIKLTTKLMKKQENQQKLTKKEEQQAEYLKRKREGLKNPELNPDIKGYSDIKADYKYTSEYKFTKADREKINKALDIVSANKQKRRTKQQWLDVANNIGLQSEKLDSEALKNIAFGSWTELSPNQKEVLNRQGAKYVPFSVDEWVKAVYKGAGVGTKIKEEKIANTQPKQEKAQTNETKPKVETKKVTKMDIQYGDHKDPRIIVGRQASTAYNKTLDQYKMQVEYLTKDAKQAIEDYGGIEKLWKDSQTMSQVEIANNFGNTNETTQDNAITQETQNVAQNEQNEGAQESAFNNVKLEERVSGDKLLDTQDFINEVKNVGAKVDGNGYVTVYHQTTPENAQKILDSGKMTSNEQGVFFSTSENASQADGRGNVKLEFKIPAENLELDDLFSDNADVKIPLKGQSNIDVSNYIVNNNVANNQNNQGENRVNDHTLEYNGYYIMSEKPNVGYEYKSLEESPRFQIYDANNDDITHNVANWINSIDEAKQYIDDLTDAGIMKDRTIKQSESKNTQQESYRDYDKKIRELEDNQYDLEEYIKDNEDYHSDNEEIEAEYQRELNEKKNELETVNKKLSELQEKRETQYLKEIQKLPNPTKKTEFEGFSSTDTDFPFANEILNAKGEERKNILKHEKLRDAYVVEMTPKEYLENAGKYGWNSILSYEEISKQMGENNQKKINEMAEAIKKGDKLPMPYLEIGADSHNQEGRHRAFAAEKAGLKTMPVLIMEKNTKLIDDTAPKKSENIPATKSENVISEKIEKPKKETKTETKETKIQEKPKKEEQQVPNKITAKDLKQASKNITKELNETFKLNKNEAYSKTPQTAVKEMSAYQNPPTISDFDRETVVHTILSDEEAKINAEKIYNENGTLEQNAAYIRGLLQSDKRLTKNDKALAVYTMKEAYNQGNKEIGDGIVQDLTVLDIEAGQWIQASKLMKQMSPVGQLETFVKMVKRSIDKGNPRFKNVKITDEMINNVIEKSYNEDNTWNQDEFAKNMEEFKQEITNQLKPTLMDKFNTLRMIGMLGAPKTHIRNMLANVGNLGLRVSKNFNARVLETAFVRDQTKRTRTFKPSTQEIKNFAERTMLEEKDTIAGNKYDERRTDLERNMKVFNENHKGIAKVMNPISKLTNLYSGGNTYLLTAEDTLFSAPTYKRSLQEFLTARGMKTEKDVQDNPKILRQAKDFALQQALESVYRQDSEMATAISNFVRKMERSDKKRHKLAGVMVEGELPFKRTPINIGKTGWEYSPIGLTSGIYDTMKSVKTGKVEISQAIDEVSKGITGLGLLGVGVLLAHNGWELTAGEDDKDKKSRYDKGLGEKEYSIKVGNRYYDVSWMAPSAMPFYTGVELYQQLVKTQKFDGNAVVGTIAKTIDPLSSMSFMQGVTRTLQSYAKSPGEILSTLMLADLENYVSQYVPTLLSQIANVSDNKKRVTTVAGDSSFRELDKTLNNIKYRVPGLRQTLQESTDSWGKTQENDSFGLRFFNSLINPANNSESKKDATDKEIERLYYALGEDNDLSTKALPKQDFDKKLTYAKKEYKLSGKEWTEFKKTYGKIAKKGANKLIKTEEYQNASDEQKAKYLESLYEYANQKAKQEYGIKHNLDYDSYKLDQIYALVDAFDIPIETAITNKSIGQLRAKNGVSGNKRKYAAVDRIDGLTELQKDVLKRKFTMFMGRANYKKTKLGKNVSYELVDALYNSNTSYEDDEYIRKFLDIN